MSQPILPLYYLLPEGTSQYALAEQTGLLRQTLGQYITGKTHVSPKAAAVLAQFCDVPEQDVVRSSVLTVELAQKGLLRKHGKVDDVEQVSQPKPGLCAIDRPTECRRTLADVFKSREVSDADIVREIDWTYQAIYKYRHGLRKMREKTAAPLAAYLGCTPADVVEASLYTVALAKANLLDDKGFVMGVDDFRCDPRALVDREWKCLDRT